MMTRYSLPLSLLLSMGLVGCAEQLTTQNFTSSMFSARCMSKPALLRAGETVEFVFDYRGPATEMEYALQAAEGEAPADLGKMEMITEGRMRYTAPRTIDVSGKVYAMAKPMGPNHVPGFCVATLIAGDAIGTADDGFTEGLVGHVYDFGSDRPQKLPDFSKLTEVSRILVPMIDIAVRAFEAGFPGLPDLYEYFGIEFEGMLNIPETGEYEFQLCADDGANFFLDGAKVIDNDGTHAVQCKTGKLVLEQGAHALRLPYFQGPRYHIALELKWRQFGKQGASPFTYIPAKAFSRPR